MRKEMVCLLISLILILGVCTNAYASWDPGDSWSYGWLYDYSEHKEEIIDDIEQSVGDDWDIRFDDLYGGFISMFSTRLLRERDGVFEFEYHGGMYSKGALVFSAEEMSGEEGDLLEVDIKTNELDSQFSGRIWIEEHWFGEEEQKVYAVKRQEITTKGAIDYEADVDLFQTVDEDRVHLSASYIVEGDWNMDLDLEYDPPLPWIPVNYTDGVNMSERSSVDKVGFLNGNIYTSIQVEGFEEYSHIYDQRISTSLRGVEKVMAELIEEDGRYRKPSPIIGGMNLGASALYYDIGHHDEFINRSIGWHTGASYSEEGNFYDHYYLSWAGPTLSMYADIENEDFDIALHPMAEGFQNIRSEPFSEDDYDEFMMDRKEYFEYYITMPRDDIPWVLYTLIPIMALGVLFIGALYLQKRKRSSSEETYQEYYGDRSGKENEKE